MTPKKRRSPEAGLSPADTLRERPSLIILVSTKNIDYRVSSINTEIWFKKARKTLKKGNAKRGVSMVIVN
jgi:hypothetical protein